MVANVRQKEHNWKYGSVKTLDSIRPESPKFFMSKILPVNLDDLLNGNGGVESERIEFKASWNPKTTGPQVIRTICAFGNDCHNLNGGYVVIGVEERSGRAVLPPKGLSAADIETAQKWIRGQCNRLDPAYHPILSPETIDDRDVLVVWAPGSDTRPHNAPDDKKKKSRFWVRLGSETVDAEGRSGVLAELMQQTARVPWDDRRAQGTKVEDLSESKVREHLRDIRSGLLDAKNAPDIYRRMRISTQINGYDVPRNVGLLFFSRDPSKWFPGAKIEVVQFTADRAGDVQDERTFGGPLIDQLRDCLNYLENLSSFHLLKQEDRSRVHGWVSYPRPALRETLVNAVYHRGYGVDQLEPTKVYLYPNRVEIYSYPGPVPGIERHHLAAGANAPAAPARNRRIGEFLKELRLAEGRLSGLPKVFRSMEENGSPEPSFEFDEHRTYFKAMLPSHPEYGALSALRDAAHLRALGKNKDAFRRVEAAWMSNQTSAVLAAELIRLHAEYDEIDRAEDVFYAFQRQRPDISDSLVSNALVDVLVNAGESEKALQFLEADQNLMFGQDAIDAAILARRARDSRAAHRYFERAGEMVLSDPRALLEFAQTKLELARQAHWQRQHDVNHRFLMEARSLLERVIQLDTSPTRHAWAWRELARTLKWLKAPLSDVEAAYLMAIELRPEEERFEREFEKWLISSQPKRESGRRGHPRVD